MIVIGAGGCTLDLISNFVEDHSDIRLFDNVTDISANTLREKYQILTTEEEVRAHFDEDKRFIISVGKPSLRKAMCEQFEKWGGIATSTIHASASVGNVNTIIASGNCISAFCFISNNVQIGKGCLINVGVSIHHDCKIGAFCEIGPGVKITGAATIGKEVFIGTNAVIAPNVKIGDNAIIGAGAVVLKDVPSQTFWAGNPARQIKELTS